MSLRAFRPYLTVLLLAVLLVAMIVVSGQGTSATPNLHETSLAPLTTEDLTMTVTPTPTPTALPTNTPSDDPSETPTDDPDATQPATATPSSTPLPDNDAPAAPQSLNVTPNQGRPAFTFDDDPLAEYFRVFIGNADYSTIVLDAWYAREDICAEGICTVEPDINPTGGLYHLWMQAWGFNQFSAGGDSIADGWSTADFNLPTTPPGPVMPLTTTVDGGAVTLNWMGAENATWYNVWIGTPDPEFRQEYFAWMLAENVGCENAMTCTLTNDSTVSLIDGDMTLPSGEYVWYIQSWGPGGYSNGGQFEPPLDAWQENEVFTVP